MTIAAPRGLVGKGARDVLRANKQTIDEILDQEERMLDMKLQDFACASAVLEAHVPEVDQTLFFVSTTEELRFLLARGVQRGRVWTAAELACVMDSHVLGAQDLRHIALIKLRLGADLRCVMEASRHDPRTRGPPGTALERRLRELWRDLDPEKQCARSEQRSRDLRKR